MCPLNTTSFHKLQIFNSFFTSYVNSPTHIWFHYYSAELFTSICSSVCFFFVLEITLKVLLSTYFDAIHGSRPASSHLKRIHVADCMKSVLFAKWQHSSRGICAVAVLSCKKNSYFYCWENKMSDEEKLFVFCVLRTLCAVVEFHWLSMGFSRFALVVRPSK